MGKTMHRRLPKKVLKVAEMGFEPCKIRTRGLKGLPSNAEFGPMMMPPSPDLALHLANLRSLDEARLAAEVSRAKALRVVRQIPKDV